MNRVFKAIFSALILGSFVVTQAPKPGDCQMAYGAFWATTCQMSCCHSKLPMPNCPLLKAATPRDLISSSALVLESSVQPLHTLGAMVLPKTHTWIRPIMDFRETLAILLIGSSQAVRAPPTNIFLIAA